MSAEQLETAAKMTSLRPTIALQKTVTPKPRATNVALKATPAPALGPEDELLFDPDEESYGNAGPGGGYQLEGDNVPLGVQVGQTSGSPMTTPTPSPLPQEPSKETTDEPLIIDLDESEKEETTPGFWSGVMKWIVLIVVLVTLGLCAMFLLNRGNSAPPAPALDTYGGTSAYNVGYGSGGGYGGSYGTSSGYGTTGGYGTSSSLYGR